MYLLYISTTDVWTKVMPRLKIATCHHIQASDDYDDAQHWDGRFCLLIAIKQSDIWQLHQHHEKKEPHTTVYCFFL